MRRPWPTTGRCAMWEEGIAHICNCRNRNGSVGIDAGLRDGQPWICVSIPGRVKRLSSSAKRPDRLCGPTCFLFNGTRGVSPVVKNHSEKLTTYPISLQLHSSLRFHGVHSNNFKSKATHGEVQSLLFRIRFNVFPFKSSSLSFECGSETDYYVYVFPNVQLVNHV